MLNNINNFFNLFKTKRIRKTLAANDLIAVGVRDAINRSEYHPAGIYFIDLVNQIGVGGVALTTAGTTGAATLVGLNLNIPQYQGQLTITTTGTTGPCTLVGDTLNVPQYQGQITLTTNGTTGVATLVGNTLNVPKYQNVSCKIDIDGTTGLSNTQNGVDFLVPYNSTVWNDSTTDFTPTGSKILINTTGKYLVVARYSSYDMTVGTDFMRLAVTTSASAIDLGNKIEYLDIGYIGTTGNGEATKGGSGVFEFVVGDHVGIVALTTGATGGPFGTEGYPVFDNSQYNQPYLEIVKLS